MDLSGGTQCILCILHTQKQERSVPEHIDSTNTMFEFPVEGNCDHVHPVIIAVEKGKCGADGHMPAEMIGVSYAASYAGNRAVPQAAECSSSQGIIGSSVFLPGGPVEGAKAPPTPLESRQAPTVPPGTATFFYVHMWVPPPVTARAMLDRERAPCPMTNV